MSNVRPYTSAQLLNKVKSLPSFKEIPSGYWLLGVRSTEDEPNKFDDKIYLFKGETFICVTSATTNPGVTVLRNYAKFNAKGAAVVKADEWYYGVWMKGKHQGKITALVQTGAKIKVYRDGDKDDKAEPSAILQEGFFGINFHPNGYDINANTTGTLVNGWSAGCQVVNDMDKYRMIMGLIPVGEKVSYCLLNEFDV
jgi:hypothetical protein